MTSWGGSRPGAGRPTKVPGQKRKVLSVTVAETTWQQVRAIAEGRGLSVSELVNELLSAAIAQPPQAAPQGTPEVARVIPQADHAAEASTRL